MIRLVKSRPAIAIVAFIVGGDRRRGRRVGGDSQQRDRDDHCVLPDVGRAKGSAPRHRRAGRRELRYRPGEAPVAGRRHALARRVVVDQHLLRTATSSPTMAPPTSRHDRATA